MKKYKLLKKYQNILITGGAGFIGSNLVAELLSQNRNVTIIDNFSRGTKENIARFEKKITIIKEDLRNENRVKKYFANQDLVINLGALNTGVDFDAGRTELMFEENMLLQMIPLRVSAKIKTIKKFIQVSSASVYSKKAMEENLPTKETADSEDHEQSKYGYALAKKIGEKLAFWYAKNQNFPVTIVRFVNVYGPSDNFDQMGHFIPVMIRKFLTAKNNKIIVFGSGNQKRSFVHVRDVVNGIIVLANKGEKGEIYNLDSGHEFSIKEVVEKIRSYLSMRKNQIHFDKSLPEGSKRRVLCNKKITKLGWEPAVDFDQGLIQTIEDVKKRLK